MAFADPQTLTVNSVAKTLAKILTSGTSATYQSSDGAYKLIISHQQSKKRIRTMVRVENRAIVTDPLTSVNDYDTLTFFMVLDRPEYGFSDAQIGYVIAALMAWNDSTAVGKLLGLQS